MKNLILVVKVIMNILLMASCSNHKEISCKQPIPHSNPIVNQSTYRSRVLQEQDELADRMDYWTCEEIEAFKRDYVYSEVNIFLKNGGTLKIK